MDTNFFNYESWRAFLSERFHYMKAVKPNFSARYFAKKAGIGSPSYFHLVVSGRRRLSIDYAERFATGLDLDPLQTKCLLTSVALETCRDNKRRATLLRNLETLRKRSSRSQNVSPSHVHILSDPINLKLYLLAQSRAFQMTPGWLRRQLPRGEKDSSVRERIALLLDSGLWVREGDMVRTMAPTIRTGDSLDGAGLTKMHENLLSAASRALTEQNSDRRIVGSRTFLCDPALIKRVQERIEAFKQDIEAEFEYLEGTQVYQLHLSFFELEPKR